MGTKLGIPHSGLVVLCMVVRLASIQGKVHVHERKYVIQSINGSASGLLL